MGKVFTINHMGNNYDMKIANYLGGLATDSQIDMTYTSNMFYDLLNLWTDTPILNQPVWVYGGTGGNSQIASVIMEDLGQRLDGAWKLFGTEYDPSYNHWFNDKKMKTENNGKFINPDNGRWFELIDNGMGQNEIVVHSDSDTVIFHEVVYGFYPTLAAARWQCMWTAFSDFNAFATAETWSEAQPYVHTLDFMSTVDSGEDTSICTFRVDINKDSMGQALWVWLGGDDPSHDDDDPGGDDDDPYKPYDPSDPVPPGDGEDPYDDGDDVPVPDLPDMGLCDSGLLAIYTPSLTQLNLLGSYLWSQNFIDSMVKNIYANPIDVIIDIGLYPFNITPAGVKEIIVGNRGSGVSSNYPSSEWFRFDCGSVRVKSVLNSCLDYMPYTKGYIFIPFVGYVPLDVDYVMGKTVGLKYNINLVTGQAVAFVTTDGKVFQEYACNLKSSIPLSQNNAARMWSEFLKYTVPLAIGGAAAGIGAAAGAASVHALGAEATAGIGGNLGALSNSAMDLSAGAMNIGARNAGNAASDIMSGMATKPSIEKSNSVGITGGFCGAKQKPCIILERANHVRADDQNMYSGYPAFMTKRLKNIKGYTEVGYSRLSIPSATQAETSTIRDIIHNGFIIEKEPTIPNGDLVLMKNKSPVNQVGKTLETVATLNGDFRHEANVSQLTIRIEKTDPIGFNYLWCSKTQRFYFINDIKIVRTGVLDLYCSCDVLESFGSELLENVCIIAKNEKEYNLLLNDGILKTQQNPLIAMYNFPNGFGGDYEFVLVVAGNQSGGN